MKRLYFFCFWLVGFTLHAKSLNFFLPLGLPSSLTTTRQLASSTRYLPQRHLPREMPEVDKQELLQCIISPNYSRLVAEFPDLLCPFWDADRQRFNFSEPDQLHAHSDGAEGTPTADVALTTALFKKHLGLEVDLDPRFLCPRLGNRLLYVVWIHDLISTSTTDARGVHGLDIGTGSSAVYPLLACTVFPDWHMTGVDVDSEAFQLAKRQVELNQSSFSTDLVDGKTSRLHLVLRNTNDHLFSIGDGSDAHPRFTFTMCNPPFYASEAEMQELERGKAIPKPGTVLQARQHELVTPGGEVQFVTRMIQDSVDLNKQATEPLKTWFTSMLGRKSSVEELVRVLKENGIENYALHELVTSRGVQGGSTTRRWLLGWNFGLTRPPHFAAQLKSSSLKHLNPAPTQVSVPLCMDVQKISSRIFSMVDRILRDLCAQAPLANCAFHGDGQWILEVPGNVWSRAYRRRFAKKSQLQTTLDGSEPAHKRTKLDPTQPLAEATTTPSIVSKFQISVTDELQKSEEIQAGYRLVVDWVYGDDPHLLESLATMLKRKLDESFANYKDGTT